MQFERFSVLIFSLNPPSSVCRVNEQVKAIHLHLPVECCFEVIVIGSMAKLQKGRRVRR